MMRALFALLSCQVLFGQVSSSTLSGRVSDSSQGAVAAAVVSLRHEATGFTRTAATQPDGAYIVESLLPGAYTVRVGKGGFRTTSVSGIRLAVGQTARLDFRIEPGPERESVTVTATVSPVEERGGAIGYRLDTTSITALPLSTRNVISLITLGPGAVPRQLGGFVTDFNTDVQPSRGAVAFNPPIHGSRSTMNTFLLDGVVNTDRNVFAVAVVPPLESVMEFRSHSAVAGSEFPLAGGGVIDVVTRTGGQKLHGSLFEYLRNEFADARGFFDAPTLPRLQFRRNQFGGSLGGPLAVAPRTFFFATYEGTRGRTAKSSLTRVPEPTPRSGDFSGLSPLFDPLTLDAAGARTPFAGNRVPTARIDSISRSYLDRFEPLPNRPGLNPNYLDATPNESTFDHVLARIDHDAGRLGRLFGRYTVNEDRERIAATFPVRPASLRLRAQQAVLGRTAGTSTVLSETRVSFTRLRAFKVPESAFKADIARELGINGAPTDPFFFGLPSFVVTNYNLVTDDPLQPQSQRDNLWQFSQDLTFLRGAHSIKFGFLTTHFELNYQQARLARGQYIFSGAFTRQTGATSGSGDPLADFLLGFPQTTNRNSGATMAYLRQNTTAGYLTDDWRITPAITLTAGVRYEFVSPYSEDGGSLQNLDYSTLPAPPVLRRTSRPVDPDRNNIAPRVALAWRLPNAGELGAWTFRAGYGVYFNPEIASETYDLIRNGLRNESNPTDGVRPVLTIRDGFPQTIVSGFPGYFGLDPNAPTPYLQRWSGGFQRELGRGMLLELAYVGSKGTSLGRHRQFNTPLRTETGENLPPRAGVLQQLRPFPLLGEIVQRQHIANSIYHALQVRAEQRLSSSLSMLASFVWAKGIDDADSVMPGFSASAPAQDERNLRLERGVSYFNVGRRVSVSALYRLPSPRSWSVAARGWELAGIVTLQDGTRANPFYVAYDGANTGTPNRPDVVPGVSLVLPRSQRTADRFFNTAALRMPAPLTFGNAGRNIVVGPGINMFDVSLHRRFALAENAALEFRAEAFNLFNHPNFGVPGVYPDFAAIFGKINSTGDPRRLQFGLRLEF